MTALAVGLLFLSALILSPVFALADREILFRMQYHHSRKTCYFHSLLLNLLLPILVFLAMQMLQEFGHFLLVKNFPDWFQTSNFLFFLLLLFLIFIVLPPFAEFKLMQHLNPSFPISEIIKSILIRYAWKAALITIFLWRISE
jgi:hypothetical protein